MGVSNSWLGRTLEKGMAATPVLTGLENSMDMGSWQATFHEIAKELGQLSSFSLSLVAVHRLLIPMASVVAERGLLGVQAQ